VAIVDPRLSIFGFGVHQEFYEACQIEDIDNGFLNRIIVLDEPVALYPKTDIGPSKVGYDLKLNLEKLYGIKTSRRLDWTPAAKEIYDTEVHRVFTETDDRRRKLWSRTPEKISRAGSTFAACRFAMKVERSDMEIAQVIMRHSDEVFRVGIEAAQKKRRLDHANIKLEIIRRLKDDFLWTENGKPIKDENGKLIYQASDFEIQRSFRHNTTHKKAVPDAVDDLNASGTLKKFTIRTAGRYKVVNRLVEE